MPNTAPEPRTEIQVKSGLTYADLRRAIFLAAALVVVYHAAAPLSTLLLFFLLVFVLAAVLNPAVVWLERRRVPRALGAAGLMLLGLALLGVVLWLLLPPLVSQTSQFFQTLPQKGDRLQAYYQSLTARFPELSGQLPQPSEAARSLMPHLQRAIGQVGRYTMNVVVGVVSLVLLLVLVLFALIQPAPMVAGLLSAVPENSRDNVDRALRRILAQLKNWAFGSLKLGVIVGVMSGVGLHFLGVPYAFLFAIIAGIGELIPNIGPIISAVPPTLIALSVDPKLALYVVILFIVVQQAENNLIVPLVMGQSLNLHPLSVTCGVLVMGSLFGLMGAVLAVPVCAIVKVCWEEFYLCPRGADAEAILLRAQQIVDEGAPAGTESAGGIRLQDRLGRRAR